MVYIDKDSLEWRRVSRKRTGEVVGGGYCVIAYDEKYNKDDDEVNNLRHLEPWELSDDLRFQFAEYYDKNPSLGVQVYNLEESDEEENKKNKKNDDDSSTSTDTEADVRDEEPIHERITAEEAACIY